jgi:class I fructose-bisphosphate aldolase
MSPNKRLSLSDMDHLAPGKRTRLYRLLYEHGPANGTLLFLPIDQGLEHGPRDFFPNPDAANPEFELRVAFEGKFSGIVFQYGIAEKYMRDYVGRVPLVLKLNGKTEIPADNAPLSPVESSVEDAVRLGADAVGYTLYVGSPRQDEDFKQFAAVRMEADRCGMPVIVWAYPRGEAIEAKGGRDSVYAVDYAVRVAAELGADVVKFNFPKAVDPERRALLPRPYNELQETDAQMIARVVASAGKIFTLVSGGEHADDAEVLQKAERSMEAGATGLIFGRNVWQRPHDEAVRLAREFHQKMQSYSR